jgi:hypothetical protein
LGFGINRKEKHKMGKRVDFVDGDDWEGLYIDGKLVLQDHSISAWEVIKLLAFEHIEPGGYHFADLDWLMNNSGLPENIEDVIIEGKNKKTLGEIWDDNIPA